MIIGAQWNWFHAVNGSVTVDINLPPAGVSAEVSFYQVDGEGLHIVGIKHYRRRLESGEDQEIDFGEWGSWPPAICDFISSITYAIALGQDQEARAFGRLDFWS